MRKVLIVIGVLALGVVIVILIVFVAFKTYPGSTIEECDKVASEKFSGEEAEDFKYSCYSDVAEEKEDITICEKIPDDNYGLEQTKISCYAGVASTKEDLSICDSLKGNMKFIPEPTKKDRCLEIIADGCWTEKTAFPEREPRSICKNAEERGIKGSTADLEKIEKSEEAKIAFCKGIKDRTYKVNCYIDAVLKAGDLSICDRIPEPDFIKEECHRYIPSRCELSSYQKEYPYCKSIINKK